MLETVTDDKFRVAGERGALCNPFLHLRLCLKRLKMINLELDSSENTSQWAFFGIFCEKKSYYFSKFVLGFFKKRIPIFVVSFNWHESSRRLSFQKRYFYQVVKKPKASQSQKSLHVVSQLRLDNSPLFATICHYLPLFSTIWHYLALFGTIFPYLPLFPTLINCFIGHSYVH
jgi:hypothetical protein